MEAQVGVQRYQRDGEITPGVPHYYMIGNLMHNENYQPGRGNRGMVARVKMYYSRVVAMG